VVYTKIIHRGVILSSAKLVLASCNQCHHINHLTLPLQPRKVVITATLDYHSNKQPPLVAMATHHNTISLSFWILELLTLQWLQHSIVNMKAKRWPYLNVYESKNLPWNLKPLKHLKFHGQALYFWSLRFEPISSPGIYCNHFRLPWKLHYFAMANKPGCRDKCTQLQWKTPQVAKATVPNYYTNHTRKPWKPYLVTITTTPSYYDYQTWIPWQSHQFTRTNT
jgi:hypothetical protein